MAVSLVELTRDTLTDYMRLKTREDQQSLVAPNVVTLAQCAYESGGQVWGLATSGRPVGLMAMIDMERSVEPYEPGDPDNAAYLWRLMIAAEYQGRGYGQAAISAAFGIAREWERTTLAVHSIEKPGNARPLYEKMGFVATDRLDDGERLMLAPVPL